MSILEQVLAELETPLTVPPGEPNPALYMIKQLLADEGHDMAMLDRAMLDWAVIFIECQQRVASEISQHNVNARNLIKQELEMDNTDQGCVSTDVLKLATECDQLRGTLATLQYEHETLQDDHDQLRRELAREKERANQNHRAHQAAEKDLASEKTRVDDLRRIYYQAQDGYDSCRHKLTSEKARADALKEMNEMWVASGEQWTAQIADTRRKVEAWIETYEWIESKPMRGVNELRAIFDAQPSAKPEKCNKFDESGKCPIHHTVQGHDVLGNINAVEPWAGQKLRIGA